MKQKKVIIRNNPGINVSSPLLFPASVRLYSNIEGNMLEVREGAVPFFIKLFFLTDGISVIPEFDTLKDQLITRNRRLSREYFLENFWIYNIGDYGHQALTQGFQDFIPFCYYADEGVNKGAKVKQHNITIIKNIVSKESFILIPKAGEETPPVLDVIIEQRNTIKRLVIDNPNTQSIDLSRSDNNQPFSFNLKTSKMDINFLDEIEVYAKEGTTEFILNNSDYFFRIEKDAFPDGESKFLAKQQTYFTSLIKRDIEKMSDTTFNKELQNINIILKDNLKNLNQITIRSKGTRNDFLYASHDSSRTIQGITINRTDDVDIYVESAGILNKLIEGVDYFVNSNRRIVIGASFPSSTSSKFEIYPRPTNNKRIVKTFTNTTTYDVHNALYFSGVNNWNIHKSSSSILIFSDGKISYFGNSESGFLTGAKNEYIIDDIKLDNEATTPTVNNNYQELPYLTFDNQNKYQVVMDPEFMVYGPINANLNVQEVFLYKDSLNMRITDLEPQININGNQYKIQGLSDPYQADYPGVSGTSFLNKMITDYTKAQHDSSSEFSQLVYGNLDIQNIEEDILQIKENLLDVLANSTVGFVDYSAGNTLLTASTYKDFTNEPVKTVRYIDKSNFSFLVVKQHPDDILKTVDISYFTNNSQIYYSTIKKEYDCNFTAPNFSANDNTNSIYISIPIYFTNSVMSEEHFVLIKNSDETDFKGKFVLVK
jgi:hypothetical protein